MRVKYADIFGMRGRIKMSINPPQCIVDSNYHIVLEGKVLQYVGIGWVEVRDATATDTDTLPQVFAPHCSLCERYEVLANNTMYCHKLSKLITARKQPCKHYLER